MLRNLHSKKENKLQLHNIKYLMIHVGELNNKLGDSLHSSGHGDKYKGSFVQKDDRRTTIVIVDVYGSDVVVHVFDEANVAGDDSGQAGKVFVVVSVAVTRPYGLAGVAQDEDVLRLQFPFSAHG